LAEAKDYEEKGYDVYSLNTSSLEAAKKIRAATNLVLMGRLRSGSGTPGMGGGQTSAPTSQPTSSELEQAVEQARKLEGIVDIVSKHGWRADLSPNQSADRL